jgi:LacI family transcriptional regulator
MITITTEGVIVPRQRLLCPEVLIDMIKIHQNMPGMNDVAKHSSEARPEQRRRGPTILEIARASGVGTATVDRVLNGRDGVREVTRKKVLDALAALSNDGQREAVSVHRRIAFLTESGVSFNRSLQEAVADYGRARDDVDCTFTAIQTADIEPVKFAQLIERTAEEADGLVIVAREDLMINRAIRAIRGRGVPVVCVTTDLPNSDRIAYVGSDQTGAGATAAYLMGRVLGERTGKILLVISAPYRGQEERELGFRRVLRSEFTHLDVEERVNSRDQVEYSYQSVRKYIQEHGPPVGIYNVAGGNLGIARALQDEGLQGKVVFIGHELNANSRMLLESGGMDFVVGHDLDREVALSVEAISAYLDGRPVSHTTQTKVRIYTKYSCN